MSKKAVGEKYQKYTQLEHVLARPDTYVGSIEKEWNTLWVLNENKDKMVQKPIEYVPGLYKIFDEILVNAIDQCQVDDNTNCISVKIENDYIIVENNGDGIPIEMHPKEKVWIPQMIFGELLTSSNYDDNEKRTVGGRNGYGAKLANIFSKEFKIETACPESKKQFSITWKNNMSDKSEPEITKYTKKTGYVKITFLPDYEKFGMTKLTDDMKALFERRVYDACACTNTKVTVSYNNTKLNYKNFGKYVDLYIGDNKQTMRVHDMQERWEVVLCHSPNGFRQTSFVNGISTSNGGSHVDHVTKMLIQKFVDKLSQKKETQNVKTTYIKDHMWVFVKSTIVNPTFSSQTKDECTSKQSSFGSKFIPSDDFIKKMYKLEILEEVIALNKYKEQRELSKTDGKKRVSVKGIPKLDDANKAGSNQSSKCTLILTEGDSAKTFAVSGLSIVGRDNYGVFPLRGKLLNTREATASKLVNNVEINALKQILGLQQGKEYNSVSELRYGKIMILTDADVDGSHIKGLLINFIHSFWPSLLKTDFITAMITPIMKAIRGSSAISFYTLPEFEQWKESQSEADVKKYLIKYYKGLGTSTANEAKEYFKDMNRNVVKYNFDKQTDESIELAFKKENADKRKVWIQDGLKLNETLDFDKKDVKYEEFINKDLIWFSISDVARSIPSAIDGFKPSQRKVFYACRKRKNTEIKVSQLAGYVSTHTSYHHGEASLMGAIIGLAQNYPGSNGINLLEPIGQFGSRLNAGKDAASPRYIFTKLSDEANNIFLKDDDAILKYLDDDGQQIEPEYYVPTIPMVLVNGADGIGTGYSTFVPQYNPKDIINVIKSLIKKEEPQEIHPWYKNFSGKIEKTSDGTYTMYGVYKKNSRTEFTITELPVGKAIEDYKDFLESICSDSTNNSNNSNNSNYIIESFENHCTENSVNFKVRIQNSKFEELEKAEKMYTTFKLCTNISVKNMHLFDGNNQIKKYNSAVDIIKDFFKVKVTKLKERKAHTVDELSGQTELLEQKVKFIRMVINDELIISKRKKVDIMKDLKANKFMMMNESYDYLLNMRIDNLTQEAIDEMEGQLKKCRDNLKILEGKTIKSIYEEDLYKII